MPGRQKITTFLWYDTQAEEAANHYVSIFPDSKILTVARYGDAGPGPKGSVMTVLFQLAGQEFIALNGGPHFEFNEAISLSVSADTQEEIDELWSKLTADGGEESVCGWLKDKYGLSWQVVPTVLGEMLRDADPARAGRVMQALMQQTKLEIDALKRAYDGGSAA